jgi:hypothetical protein
MTYLTGSFFLIKRRALEEREHFDRNAIQEYGFVGK